MTTTGQMIANINPFDPNLMLIFSSEEQKDLKICIQHCNLQIKNEQRSWAKIVYDNKVTMIALVASSVITRIALNSMLSMSMVALPLAIVPIFYAVYKFSSLQNEASDRLIKTQKIFINIFYKYGSEDNTTVFSQKDQNVNFFIKKLTDSPRKFASLEAKETVDEIIKNNGEYKGLGALAKVVFSQVVKDQKHLDKINDYQSTFHMGSTSILLTAQNIDQFFGPYSFLASKPFLVTSVLFTIGVVSGYAAYNYIKHWNDPEIGKDTFREALPELNNLLEIPPGRFN